MNAMAKSHIHVVISYQNYNRLDSDPLPPRNKPLGQGQQISQCVTIIEWYVCGISTYIQYNI